MKLKEFKEQHEADSLRECTFKPAINRTSVRDTTRPATAHERLWELSKAKR